MKIDELHNKLKKSCETIKGKWEGSAFWCETNKLIIKSEPRREEIRITDKKKEIDIAINNKDIGEIEADENCIKFKAPSETGKRPNTCDVCVRTIYEPNTVLIECIGSSGGREKIIPNNIKIIKR